MSITETLIRLWEIDQSDDSQIQVPDIIVAITYGSKREKLAEATRLALVGASLLGQLYPFAKIAYGCPSNCYPNSEVGERKLKEYLLIVKQGINPVRVLSGEVCSNSITEATAVKHTAKTHKCPANSLLVICTRVHARSIRHIWKKTFPEATIILSILSGDPDVEVDHQILLQRGRLRWLLANIARHCAMRVFGLEFVKRIQHPNAG